MADKSVLISIRPRWVNLILSGKKTLEIRRTRPNLKPPFKCYIYCSKGRKPWVRADIPGIRQDGYVVAEFICDNITRLTHVGFTGDHNPPILAAVRDKCRLEPIMDFDGGRSCLTLGKIDRYLDGGDGFAWHISGLTIYDSPKDLSQFAGTGSTLVFDPAGRIRLSGITRPPQDWRYAEVL